ncbi:MAG TPA: Smr/MutS family protein [Pseudonocardiaceae bacterium]|nr:Smr/MutS family protein [Pseudonocardiaceae bacterium]
MTTGLTLDLHPNFRNDRDIDRKVREVIFRAVRERRPTVEIITGKGSGKLRGRVLAMLGAPHLKKLYKRYEVDPDNDGRILVHFSS